MSRDRNRIVLRRSVIAAAATFVALGTAFSGSSALAAPVPAPPAADAVSSDSIAAARILPIGTTVTVTGTATSPSGVFESSFYDKGFGLQSGNSGIYISDPENSGIAVGDRVEVTGALADQEGLLVVRPTAVKRLGSGVPVQPRPVLLGDIGENTEGLLVSVTGYVTGPATDDLPYGYKVNIAGVTGSTVVFVNTQTGIDVGAIQIGRPLTVVGISGQYADTYEILPRSSADLSQSFTGIPGFGS
ncbi:hypothetical protein ABH922_004772 [Rhodococcus sp. 27YEA15]|uniref:hypothetical protein n=1 Tax=Rhodococcus sp. 27YEA15 TaxID=3156259 RepID=UPI003C7B45DA